MTRFSFLFNDTATTEIYTLSLHDALPIYPGASATPEAAPGSDPGAGDRHLSRCGAGCSAAGSVGVRRTPGAVDRKSTRLNSSHANLVCRLLLEKQHATTPRAESYGLSSEE